MTMSMNSSYIYIYIYMYWCVRYRYRVQPAEDQSHRGLVHKLACRRRWIRFCSGRSRWPRWYVILTNFSLLFRAIRVITTNRAINAYAPASMASTIRPQVSLVLRLTVTTHQYPSHSLTHTYHVLTHLLWLCSCLVHRKWSPRHGSGHRRRIWRSV